MASLRKSYFLAPSWDLKPDEITLGSVVANFRTPQNALSDSTLPAALGTPVHSPTEEKACSGTAKKSKQWSAGLFATFIQFITLGGQVSFSANSMTEVEYSCDTMETRTIVPSLSDITKATEDTRVKEHLKMGGLRAQVFMITGIKVAHKVTITTTEEKDEEMTAQFGVDIPPAQVTIGPKGSHKSIDSRKHTRTIEGPIVFAFQVEKIRVNRKGRPVSGNFVDGAMLGKKDGDANDYVIELAGQDLDEDEIDDFDVTVHEGNDETGEPCDIIVP